MKKVWIGMIGAAAIFAAIPETMAHPGGHHKNDGLALAAGIVNLVKAVVAPTPVVVAPAPVVVPEAETKPAAPTKPATNNNRRNRRNR